MDSNDILALLKAKEDSDPVAKCISEALDTRDALLRAALISPDIVSEVTGKSIISNSPYEAHLTDDNIWRAPLYDKNLRGLIHGHFDKQKDKCLGH